MGIQVLIQIRIMYFGYRKKWYRLNIKKKIGSVRIQFTVTSEITKTL